MKRSILVVAAAVFSLGILSWPCRAQLLGTAFTYQGELRTGGVPATGLHDLRFRLYDAATGGTQVGPQVCLDNVSVADGRFTVSLDFGAQFAGLQRFLEIEVRADTGLNCANAAGFTVLGPRQPLTGTPNALFALNAAQLNGQPSSFYQNAANLTGGTLPDARLSGTYSGLLSLTNAGNVFAGSGAGLTGLNATNIASGTLADARLSGNVALLNAVQTFTAAKTFSVAPSFTAAGAPFTVTSSTLVANLNADRLDGLDSTAFLLSGAAAGGDLAGTYPNPTVARLQTRPVSSTAPASGQVLKWDGSQWAPAADAVGSLTLPFSGSANVGSGAVFSVTNTATTGDPAGVWGESQGPSGYGVVGWARATSGVNYGVWGGSHSPTGVGVLGWTTATTGSPAGVWGESQGPSGYGVVGWARATSGVNYGVWGGNHSPTGVGVFGYATATSGTTYGVRGKVESPAGWAGYFEGRGYFSGNVGIGTASPAYRLHVVDGGSTARAVFGVATAASGVTYGGYFQCDSQGGTGVFGEATATSGAAYGVYGRSNSTFGRGVIGLTTATSGAAYGVHGQSDSTSGRGVFGHATAASGITYGGRFESDSPSGTGVFGRANAITGTNYGVFGSAAATGGTTYGVYGQSDSPNGYGVYFVNRLAGTGTKSFQIDHPLTPETHYLNHFCTEAPEPLNAYSGNVVTDELGYAVVQLPDYFESINRDFRYQLTVVDDGEQHVFVLAKVVRKIKDNQFTIRTSAPNVEVSWRVEAVRHDRYVQQYGFQTVQEKEDEIKGKYVQPELYGKPRERGIHYRPDMERPAPAAPPREQADLAVTQPAPGRP